jgi:hypothetical protein
MTIKMRFFISHFYSKIHDGPNGVSMPTSGFHDGIAAFFETTIYLPINLHKQWSLCIVMNPCNVRDFSFQGVTGRSCKVPIILHFDLIGLHSSSLLVQRTGPQMGIEPTT